jgi:hypothetical protein
MGSAINRQLTFFGIDFDEIETQQLTLPAQPVKLR